MKQLLWRPSALRDLDNIHQYIFERHPQAASHVINKIYADAQRSGAFPLSGRKGETPNTYEIVVTQYPYVVVYEIGEDIEVIAVFHTAQER